MGRSGAGELGNWSRTRLGGGLGGAGERALGAGELSELEEGGKPTAYLGEAGTELGS